MTPLIYQRQAGPMWKRRLYSEPLERRDLLAVGVASFDSAAGIVRFSGDLNGSIDDSLVLGESGGFLTHNATVGIYFDNRDIDPGIGIANLNLATATLILADLGAGMIRPTHRRCRLA